MLIHTGIPIFKWSECWLIVSSGSCLLWNSDWLCLLVTHQRDDILLIWLHSFYICFNVRCPYIFWNRQSRMSYTCVQETNKRLLVCCWTGGTPKIKESVNMLQTSISQSFHQGSYFIMCLFLSIQRKTQNYSVYWCHLGCEIVTFRVACCRISWWACKLSRFRLQVRNA